MSRSSPAALALVIALTMLPAAAWAQQAPYPGPTTSVQPSGTAQEQDGGVLGNGAQRTIESCGFAAGDRPSVTFGGNAAGSELAEVDGCARTQVEVLGTGTVRGTCRARVNDQVVNVRAGRVAMVVEGQGANGATRTVTTALTVSCVGNAAVARTGADVGRLVAAGVAAVLVGLLLVRAARLRRRRITIA